MLEATVQELAASGVAGLSLEAVARHAEVHKATLYRRWGTRERLLLELMREQAAEAVPVPNTGSLRQDLIALAQAAVGNSASPSVEPILRAIIAELTHNPAVANAAQQFWRGSGWRWMARSSSGRSLAATSGLEPIRAQRSRRCSDLSTCACSSPANPPTPGRSKQSSISS